MQREYLTFTQAHMEYQAREEKMRQQEHNAVQAIVREFMADRPKRRRNKRK
jgi:hypothetical protein